MTLEARTFHSGDVGETRSPSAKVKSTPIQSEREVFSHEEVFGDFTLEPFTLDEALEALEISELELQKLLESKGFISIGDFDRDSKFPVEWLKAIDSHKWIRTD